MGLGHDIGNIVLPMLCYLDALDSLDLPDEARPQLKALRESAMHLKRLSNGLNLFTHDTADASGVPPQTILHTWWEEVKPIVQKSLPNRVALVAEVPADLPAVNCPAHQLTLAILNLVTNAGEAIADRGRIYLRARRGGNEQTIVLTVTDSGQGMSEEIRRHALDPFFTTKKRGLSTGLGLSQVNDIVKAAGGRVMIESSPGQGTTVTLELPVATVEAPAPWAAHNRSASIVMSDARIASYARTVLESAGFRVHLQSAPAPDDSLMIVDGDDEALARACEFVAQKPHRRAIVLGSTRRPPVSDDVVVIDRSHRALQRELQRAARETPWIRSQPFDREE